MLDFYSVSCCVLWLASVACLVAAAVAYHRSELRRVRQAYCLKTHDQALMSVTERAVARRRQLAAEAVCEAWKRYALGYEVFCEATFDGDIAGVLNALTEIAAARDTLQALNQYDA